jgi:carboxypeptidase C (cathepsin A)
MPVESESIHTMSAKVVYIGLRFIFATESYGGHYGPAFVTYFEEQNDLIAAGTIDAIPIVVSALMINKYVTSILPSLLF